MTPEEIELHKVGMKYKFIYSIFGLVVGILCIAAGTFLGINGVVGHTSWTASLFGLSTNINDAAPGVIVFIVGIFFVLITKFKVQHIVQNPTVQRSAPPDDGGKKPGEISHVTTDEPPPTGTSQTDQQKYGSTPAPSYSSGGGSNLTYTVNTKL